MRKKTNNNNLQLLHDAHSFSQLFVCVCVNEIQFCKLIISNEVFSEVQNGTKHMNDDEGEKKIDSE